MDDESQGKGSLEPVTAGSPPAAARPRQSTRAFLVPVVVFVGLAVLAAVVGFVLYSRQAAEVRTRQGTQLTVVRDLKSDEITRWMDDQRAHAALISGDGLLGETLEGWIARGHPAPFPPTVRQIVVTYRVGHAYSRIVVLDAQLEPVFASPARGPALGPATLALARRASREDRVVFSDLFLDERGRPMMEFLAPVRDLTPSPRARLGVYVLQIDPATLLFPLIQTWPTPSDTAETLLVEKRGGRVVYLNDLRHRDDTALKLAVPPSADERPAMLAAQGRRGVVAGLDYRGVRVLASVGPVKDTPWYVVAKIDRSEVDASLRGTALATIGVVVGVILFAGLLLVLFWARREGRQLRRLYEAERELRASEQRFKTAFDHAPVGVSLTLPDGKVGHPNVTFAEMLGYSVAELEGLTVAEITHPDDRAETARLIEVALAGEIDGFKADGRYLRKDGSDVWATVSVTLLRDEPGRPVHFVAMISDISARKAAESALRESEARFRGLFESSLSGFALHEIVLDESGVPVDYVFVEANRAFYELTGLDAAHVVGRRASEVFVDVPEPPYLEIYGETALGGQTHRFETYFEPLDRHFDIQVYSPQPGQFATGFVDVTERMRAQRTLEAFFDSQSVGLGILDRDLRYVRVNETLADINQVSVPDHLGRTFQDVLPDHGASIVPVLERALQGEEVDGLEASGGTTSEPDVEHHWLASYFPVAGEGGSVEAIGLVAIDITGRRDAERDLEENRRFLERVLDVTPDLIHIFDIVAQRNVFSNREMVEILGYTPEEVVEMGADVLPRLLYPDDAPIVAEHHRKAALLADGETREAEYRMLHRDGAWRVLRSRDSVFRRGEDGAVTQLIGTAQDITEQRAAEEEVRRQRDFSATVQRVAGALIVVFDPEGHIVAFNQACEAATGFTEAELLGAPLWDQVIPPEQLEGVRATFDRLSAGQFPVDYENDWLTKDGGRRTIQWSNSAVLDGEGVVEYIIGTGIDVTERKQAEEGRREAERELSEMNEDLERRVLERTFELEAANKELEAFSYSASHDLRAPLRALDGFSLALLEDYGEQLDDTGKDYLARVRAASQRMGQLIDDLLMLSRVTRREMVREKVDLSVLARDVLADLREAEPERAVDAAVADGLVANGDPALLRIVLQNLLANAWKFTARKPKAHIEVGVDRRDGVAAYYVRDDGAGFDATYVDKLFTAFQRLHAADEFSGTGIGLATVKRIVRRHGGSVRAEGAVDSGATFYFTLH